MKTGLLLKLFLAAALIFVPLRAAEALSPPHHLYLFGRRVVQAVWAPVQGALIDGPREIKRAYHYEVWGNEKPEKNGRLSNKLFGLWRAPGVEAKAIIDGTTRGVELLGDASKQLISIVFSD